MSSNKVVKTSKFLSLVLRHKPETINIELSENGWVSVDVLIEAANAHGKCFDRPLLEEVVRDSDKKRFAFSEDGERIRASQGHSLNIDLGLESQVPPDKLYHGTATRFLDSIREEGLTKRNRHHVHLTLTTEAALNVGSRYGAPVLLSIDAKAMHTKGMQFYVSQNGVWLTDSVSTEYIKFD